MKKKLSLRHIIQKIRTVKMSLSFVKIIMKIKLGSKRVFAYLAMLVSVFKEKKKTAYSYFSSLLRGFRIKKKKFRLMIRNIFPFLKKPVVFKSYREKYRFSDLEIILFLGANIIFISYLIYTYFSNGISIIVTNMFFIFLLPLSLLIFFEIKAKLANRKKAIVLKKRKIRGNKGLDEILLMNQFEDEVIINNYLPDRKIELELRKYIDINYELKQRAKTQNYDVVIGIKKTNSLVSGYLANVKS